MGKLPTSSRPDRRKPSKTFNHPYQLNVFDPPPASSLREAGWLARSLTAFFLALIGAYLTGAYQLPDGIAMKGEFLNRAILVAGVLAATMVFEALRTFKAFDHPKLGSAPKWVIVTIYFLALLFAVGAVIDLPARVSAFHAERVLEKERAAAERRRKEEEQLAECNAQKAREVESLIKRRQTAYADHKKCLADWQKPSLFSTETADEACAPKLKEHQQAAAAVKAREAKACAPAK